MADSQNTLWKDKSDGLPFVVNTMLTLIKLLAPFAILAAIPLAILLWLLSLAELDVKADRVIIGQKNEQLGIAAEAIMDKGKLTQPIVGKMKRRKK